MNFWACGVDHLLVESDSLEDVLSCYAVLESDPPVGVLDLVPAARTLLVEFDRQVTSHATLRRAIARVEAPARSDSAGETPSVTISIRYDGEDAEFVKDFLALSHDGLVRWHTSQVWTVAFTGFAPGFGYLVGDLHDRPVPRLDSPRVDVPAGAVALAGEFTGIYPRSSPGGWRIIGHTEDVLWDLRREPPALLVPGGTVKFVEAR